VTDLGQLFQEAMRASIFKTNCVGARGSANRLVSVSEAQIAKVGLKLGHFKSPVFMILILAFV
jgi:hypothetical protein